MNNRSDTNLKICEDQILERIKGNDCKTNTKKKKNKRRNKKTKYRCFFPFILLKSFT